MLRFHKIISAVLHPVVMPTIGVLLYFIFIPIRFTKQQQLVLLSIVFATTYIIPVCILAFLKAIGKIKDFRVYSIKERKIPMFFMICFFLMLGFIFLKASVTRDFAYLFLGTSLGLIIIYILFDFQIKASLHLLSMGSSFGFFFINQFFYVVSLEKLLMILVFLSGILGTSRLYLKAHKHYEVYLGFSIGFLCQLLIRAF